MPILGAIFILGFLVFFHELGHFLLARKAGIVVEGFSIGFGPALLKWQGKETLYSIKLIPLGGSCQMKGEDLEDTSEGSFYAASVGGRFLAVLAGPIFNISLGLILGIILVLMNGYQKPMIHTVREQTPAYEAGMKVGDEIIEISGTKIHNPAYVSILTNQLEGKEVSYKVRRDERILTFNITPAYDKELSYYYIGVSVGQLEKANLPTAIKEGFFEVITLMDLTFRGIGSLLTGKVPIQSVSGPVGIIGSVSTTLASQSNSGGRILLTTIFKISMLISVNLGLMNLIPFPGLDGARLIFLMIEGLFKKPISRKVEGYVHMGGMIILFTFMIFIIFKDIFQLFR